MKLFQFAPAFGLPVSESPFCTKVEIYLRLTQTEYSCEVGRPRKSPNSQVPYAMWPDGTSAAGSDEIIARLERQGVRLDSGLTPSESARHDDIVEIAQSVVYFGGLYSRFSDPGWTHQKALVQARVPKLTAWFSVPQIRRARLKLCARHGFKSVTDTGKPVAAIEAIEERLGQNDFLFGNRCPRVADCAVWAMLTHTAFTLVSSPARTAVRNSEHLMGYIQRLARRADLTLPPLG